MRTLLAGCAAAAVAVTLLMTATSTASGRTATGATHWAGKWRTNWGTMVLRQHGTKVTGTYTWKNGRIVGTASGEKLTGTWSQSPTHKGPKNAGPFVWTMNGNGEKFRGLWAYEGLTPSRSWTGVRIG